MTIHGWMVYALAISLLVAPAAWLLEHGLARLGLATRWVWLGALVLSLAIPVVGGVRAGRTTEHTVVGEAPAVQQLPTEVQELAPFVDRRGSLRRIADGWSGRFDEALASVASRLPSGAGALRWTARLWAGVSLLLGLLVVGSLVRLGWRSRTWPRADLLGRTVRVSTDLGPATVGLLVPQIVLPRWARSLRSRELELVLMHEEEHASARDPLVLAAGLVPVIACPWNPIVWWQLRRLAGAVEVDCDHRVLRRGASPRSYGDLLLRLGGMERSTALAVPTMAGSHSLLERRLVAMKTKTRLRMAVPRALAVTAAAAGLLMTACGTDAPVDVVTQEAGVEQERLDPFWITVDADGTVHVEGARHPIEQLSEVVGPRNVAAGGKLVVRLLAPKDLPYDLIARAQEELPGPCGARVGRPRAGGAPS
jgi:hypothetical protein